MRLALCNEVLRDWPFERQCAFAAAVGYDGLEVAPFTLAADPRELTAAAARRLAAVAADHGVAITGLHWLLLAPEGLSLTDPDPAVAERTRSVILHLVELCAAMGGAVLVHGSPAQRRLDSGGPGGDPARARDTALAHLAAAGGAARQAGVTYCLEPLGRDETDFVNTVAEAVGLLETVDEPGLKTMIDTSAAGRTERLPVPDLIDRWLPTGHIAHVQVNDRNRRGPGEGDDRFAPVLAALARNGWSATVAVEPFVYDPDGPAVAARAAGYLRGLAEAAAFWKT